MSIREEREKIGELTLRACELVGGQVWRCSAPEQMKKGGVADGVREGLEGD